MASFRIRELARPTPVIAVKVLMSNSLAQKTSVLPAFARGLGPSNNKLELARQVRDYYLLVYIILSREKSQLVVDQLERYIPPAAKADGENKPVIAAVNRCATQNQTQGLEICDFLLAGGLLMARLYSCTYNSELVRLRFGDGANHVD